MKSVVIALAALAAMSGVAFAQDASSSSAAPPAETRVYKFTTDAGGPMTLNVTGDKFDGTYELSEGKLAAELKDGAWTGYWAQSSSGQECPTEQLGSKYWGKISFAFAADMSHFDGKWGYCDDAPDSGWTGDKPAQ